MGLRKLEKNELKFEDFEPVSELQELPEKYIVLVTLPGFRKEDFRVQVDALGNLSVKGQKQIDNSKCKRFNKVFQLSPDSDIEKIRGRFEGDVLTLSVPRREKALPTNKEMKDGEKKEEETKSKEESKPMDGEKKEEETKPKEEPKQTSDKKDEEVKPKEAKTDNKIEEEPKTDSEKGEEIAKKKEQTSKSDTKEAASRINDTINKWKQSNNISDENKESTTKKKEVNKIFSWKERISQEAKGWSDYASFDNMLEVINRNKKEIIVGVAAFSIVVLVSRKLWSRK